MTDFKQWEGFEGRIWKEEVNTRDFIQKNYTPYDGDESFLAGPTDATNKLWGALQKLQKAERAKGGVLDMETEVVSSLTAYGPGYIDEELKDLEQVVGLQTDKPLKRAFMPYGGIKMAEQACTTYGYQPSEELHKIFTDYTRTHNQAVFDAYTLGGTGQERLVAVVRGVVLLDEVAHVDFLFPDTALKAFPLFKIDHWNLLAPCHSIGG